LSNDIANDFNNIYSVSYRLDKSSQINPALNSVTFGPALDNAITQLTNLKNSIYNYVTPGVD
jgi:hypothetical protein